MEYIRKNRKAETNILDNYIASEKTYMIMPARHIAYDSIILEENATYCVRQTPFNIIRNTCEEDWAMYEGRKQIISKRMEYKNKTPIFLHKERNVFAFPTMGADTFECAWILLRDRLRIQKAAGVSSITFPNGQTIQLDISFHILEAQLEKTEKLAYVMNPNNIYHIHKGDVKPWDLF